MVGRQNNGNVLNVIPTISVISVKVKDEAKSPFVW